MYKESKKSNVYLLLFSVLVIIVSVLICYFQLFDLSKTTHNSSTDSSNIVTQHERLASSDNAKTNHVQINNDAFFASPKGAKTQLDPSLNQKKTQQLPISSSFLDELKDKSLNNIIPVKNNGLLNVSNVNTFNNVILAPLIERIIALDYFRFVKLNMRKKCSLWTDITKCALRDCSIQFCEDSDLPQSLFEEEQALTNAAQSEEDCPQASPIKLAKVEYTVSTEKEETLDTLFECYGNDLEEGQYVDLIKNPERFTGFKGENAHRVWRSIYDENCFFKNGKLLNPFSLDNMCYEERVFYRAISGLHTSINIHLCASYALLDGTFTHNLNEFLRRFEGKEGFLTNLYFLYLLELRALHKAEQYLLSKVNWQSSVDPNATNMTKEYIRDLTKVVRSFKWHFDESTLFKQEPKVAHEFAEHFRNITTNIMNCVACDKCKLWGKVQIHGLGTAFKILITDNVDNLHLSRHEITTLINAVEKLSSSIRHIDTFNKLIHEKDDYDHKHAAFC